MIEPKLKELAEQLLDEALREDVSDSAMPIDRKVDIFKAISTFHISSAKLKTKPVVEDTGPDMSDYKRRLQEAELEGDILS